MASDWLSRPALFQRSARLCERAQQLLDGNVSELEPRLSASLSTGDDSVTTDDDRILSLSSLSTRTSFHPPPNRTADHAHPLSMPHCS